MKELNVEFVSYGGGGAPDFITRILEKHYDVRYGSDSDYIFVGPFEPSKYANREHYH